MAPVTRNMYESMSHQTPSTIDAGRADNRGHHPVVSAMFSPARLVLQRKPRRHQPSNCMTCYLGSTKSKTETQYNENVIQNEKTCSAVELN